MIETIKKNKGKFISLGAALSAIAASISIWLGLGLPLLVWDHQLAAASEILNDRLAPIILVSRDYVEQRSYNLKRENLEIREKLLNVPPTASDHKRLLEDVLKSNELRQQRLKELDKKLQED